MGCRWRERHRALGWCRGPSSRDGDLRGRVPALAQGHNPLAPRLSSNRRQSPVSPCVSATRTRRAFSSGSHGPMTRLESLGVLAAMIFIAALIVGTAFPALLCLACCPRGSDNRWFIVPTFRDLSLSPSRLAVEDMSMTSPTWRALGQVVLVYFAVGGCAVTAHWMR